MLSYKTMLATSGSKEQEEAGLEFAPYFSRALEATRIKSHLLTEGVAIHETALLADSKPLIVGLYLHSDQRPSAAFPQEIVIDDLRGILPTVDGPFISNVRINPRSPWKLVKEGGRIGSCK